MIRKVLFRLYLSAGDTAGLFIFVMAATGVVLSFERQIIDFVDRNIRSVTIPNDSHPRPTNDLLQAVRRAGMGEPTAIVLPNQPQAATQLNVARDANAPVSAVIDTGAGGNLQSAPNIS
jgi:uncharacterized iron-regulated membrane protein